MTRPVIACLALAGSAALSSSSLLAATPEPLAATQLQELEQLLQRGECAQLFERVDELSRTHPDQPDLMTLSGNCHLQQGRSEERVFNQDGFEELRISIGRSVMRDDLRERLYRREVSFERDAVKKATALFRRALDAAPDRPDLIVGNVALLVNIGKADDGMKLLARRRATLDRAALNGVGRLVEDLVRNGKFREAQELASKIGEALPEAATGPAGSSYVNLILGRVTDAIADLEIAHEREPTRASVTNELIRLLMTARRYEAAVSLLVPLASNDSNLEFMLALAREQSHAGSSKSLWERLKQRSDATKRREPASSRVIDYYVRSVSSSEPPTPVMRLRMARLFLENGLLLPGLVEADRSVAEDPGLIEAWVLLSDVYRSEFMLDLALEALDRALSSVPDDDIVSERELAYSRGELTLDRAQVLLGLGRYDEALAAYRAAAASGRAAPDEHALAALSAGKRGEAVRMLRGVAEADGERSAWAAAKLQQLGEIPPPVPANVTRDDEGS